MKLKQAVWFFILALFLAACGTQQPPQLADIPEVTIDASTLSAQGKNDHKHVKLVFVKKIEGDAPKHAHYKVTLRCLVKDWHGHGKHAYVSVVSATFRGEGKGHIYAPKKLLGGKCTLSEKGTLGDKVIFRVVQIDKDHHGWDHSDSKWQVFKQEIDVYKGHDKVTSEHFYLKKDFSVLRIVTKNVYGKDEHKDIKFSAYKDFKKHYDLDDYDVFYVTLYCDYHEVATLELSSENDYKDYDSVKAKDVKGKKCYVEERYEDKDHYYELKKVEFDFYEPYDEGDSTVRAKYGKAYSYKFHVDHYPKDIKVHITNTLDKKGYHHPKS